MQYLCNYLNYEEQKSIQHSHKHYEIIIYLNGKGTIYFANNKYFVEKGTIVVIPPNHLHHSVSEDNLQNIYVAGNFEHIFNLSAPAFCKDSKNEEGSMLARLIYKNRYGNQEYLDSLCNAYGNFILQNIEIENDIGQAVRQISNTILHSFYDSSLDLHTLLLKSGYAEDYIRAQFKKINGKSPVAFLSDVRIKHAKHLIQIYRHSLSLSQIAELCGYSDYIYFSRVFKSITGTSPQQYKSSL